MRPLNVFASPPDQILRRRMLERSIQIGQVGLGADAPSRWEEIHEKRQFGSEMPEWRILGPTARSAEWHEKNATGRKTGRSQRECSAAF